VAIAVKAKRLKVSTLIIGGKKYKNAYRLGAGGRKPTYWSMSNTWDVWGDETHPEVPRKGRPTKVRLPDPAKMVKIQMMLSMYHERLIGPKEIARQLKMKTETVKWNLKRFSVPGSYPRLRKQRNAKKKV
jgi:hypothetical protein